MAFLFRYNTYGYIFRKEVHHMKKLRALLLALICLLSLAGCSQNVEITAEDINAGTIAQTGAPNEVLTFLDEKYGLAFRLWGPEGHDLYVFHIFPDHAERECHILMPANTDDIAEFHANLAWEIAGNELIITGDWEESFLIDISANTATSTATGKVYEICEAETPLE